MNNSLGAGGVETKGPVPESVLLDVKGIRVRYANGAWGALDVSLQVGERKVVACFGTNGAGKTTTMRAIGGFLKSEGARVTSGRVLYSGRDTTNWEPHRVAGMGISFVPERRKVFPHLTVRENLTAIGRLPPRAVRRDRLDRIFELFPVLSQRGKEAAGRLSGGQQQMLAIARGLFAEPRLLIVDELTLGLHQSIHEPLFDAVRRIADEGTSVLLVDETVGIALDVADYCYVFVSGTVKSEGRPEVFRGNELLAAGYLGA